MSRVAKKWHLTEKKQKLVVDNIGLAFHIAYRFINQNPQFAHEEDEVLDHIFEKLCFAANTYDTDRDNRFSTYASKSIKTGISRYLELRNRYNSRYVTVAWEQDYKKNKDSDTENRSQGPSWNDNNSTTWKEIEETLLSKVELSEQEISVLDMLYSKEMTFSAIAKNYNCTRQNIQHIENKILDKIRKYICERGLFKRDFI